jgi:hypothetical protein
MWYPIRSRDEEKRKLRCQVENLRRAHKAQKTARERTREENRKLKRQVKDLKEKLDKMEKDNKELKRQRDMYRNMVFKPNKKPKGYNSTPIEEDFEVPHTTHSKRGRKKGHKGSGRHNPKEIDYIKRIHLTHCPICHNKVDRSDKMNKHIVEDIPSIERTKTEVTCHEIEEQWCSHCKKRVRAKPMGVIPKSRLGINLLIYAIIQKYGSKSSWGSIVFTLLHYFNVKVSEGALINMMHRAREWLGPYYDRILEEIRKSPVKHADETQWRIDGLNYWLWGFFIEQAAYYVVEESRGKGAAEENLKYSHPEDVLVRDDYGAYKNLPMKQQSCWAHLLRTSKEEASDPEASMEAKALHNNLQMMYGELSADLAMPFNNKGRERIYDLYSAKIEDIIQAKYKYNDTKRVQTRIANQNTNLITALKYKNVPLTNNLAERCIRPFVIVRKMSGGSRSWDGAKTQAINMSVFQTIKMQGKPLIPTLKKYLLAGCCNN